MSGLLTHGQGKRRWRLANRLAAMFERHQETETHSWQPMEPGGWALISDVGNARAGVPEALTAWRRARGETPPEPML